MKRQLLVLLLCLSLLGVGHAAAEAAPARLLPTKETENDILRQLPLGNAECRFFAWDGDLLLLYTKDESTSLLRYRSTNRMLCASFRLGSGQWEVQAGSSALCCYCADTHLAILLSSDLQEIRRFSLPDAEGTPVLSCETVYYSTAESLMALELSSGLHRLLRESASGVLALGPDGNILCSAENRTQILSPEDGTLLEQSVIITASAQLGSRSAYCVKCGENSCLYIGEHMLCLPLGWQMIAFLPPIQGILLYRPGFLEIYDTTTGNRLARLPLESAPIQAAMPDREQLYFQLEGADSLQLWMPEFHPIREPKIQVAPRYTADSPDEKGLQQCRRKADILGQQYCLRILLNRELPAILPAGCEAEPEHLTVLITDALEQLDQTLAAFPRDFLRQVFAPNPTICPVRQITKDGKMLPFLDCRSSNCLLIPISDSVDTALIRAITARIDTRVFSCCDVFDRWECLNPPEFRYGESAQWDAAAFADPAGTLSPTDDRAGVLHYAMAEGSRERFSSAILQNKLRTLCTALRQVYALSGALPWEQYLWEPIA